MPLKPLLLITFVCGSLCSDPNSFKNVKIWIIPSVKNPSARGRPPALLHCTMRTFGTYNTEIYEEVTKSNSLKNHLPNVFLRSVLPEGRIPVLYENSTADFQTRRLRFIRNHMQEIRPGAFRNLTKLETLDVSYNELTKIERGTFDNLPMYTLSLALNNISIIEPGAFLNLPNLKTLYLYKNKMTKLQENVFSNLNIENLDLDSNKISIIAPNTFNNMSKLVGIELRNNQLTEFNPNWFYNTVNIKWLILRYNRIVNIYGDGFQTFRNFSKLDLGHNKIEIWKETAFSDVQNITFLDLSFNNLKCIEGNFSNVFKADITQLDNNPLNSECKKNIEEWKKYSKKNLCLEFSYTADECDDWYYDSGLLHYCFFEAYEVY